MSLTAEPGYRGQRLGLPADGPTSIASVERRIGSFLIDCLAAGLVAALFTAGLARHRGADSLPGSWSLIPLLLDYVIGLPLAGRTLGMNLFGLRVVRIDGARRVTIMDATLRFVLLALLVPAVIWDKDQRGLHDRAAHTVVVRA